MHGNIGLGDQRNLKTKSMLLAFNERKLSQYDSLSDDWWLFIDDDIRMLDVDELNVGSFLLEGGDTFDAH